MLPAEQLALWADRLRDMAAAGLLFARDAADRARYEEMAQAAITLWAAATGRSRDEIARRRAALFALPTPHTHAHAVLLDGDALWLSGDDRDGWRLPGGPYRQPDDTPAAGLTRLVAAQTGLTVLPRTLTGVYDSPPRAGEQAVHAYIYVFTAVVVGSEPSPRARRFLFDRLPPLPPPQQRRLDHALAVQRGAAPPFFRFNGVTP